MLPGRSMVHLLFQECWIRLNREESVQAFQHIRETGPAYVSLFAEKYIGSPFVQKDLMAAVYMVDAMAAVALYAWRQQHPEAGRDEVYQYFLKTPFSQLIDNGIYLYRQVVGDPSVQDGSDWSADLSSVTAFARDYPVFLRVRNDVETLKRIAAVLGFVNDEAFRCAKDAIIELREDGNVLHQALRSLLAGMVMGFKKPWLMFYPDDMLKMLRTLYLDHCRAHSKKLPTTLETVLSNDQISMLTAQDRELMASCLRGAVIELQRLWGDHEYLSEMIACPGPETFYSGKQSLFRRAFLDTSRQMFDGDHCAGTREWDLSVFNLPVWIVFLEKASGIAFKGEEYDTDAQVDYLRSLCANADEYPLQWERASLFLMTDAPWIPVQREHYTLIFDALKRAVTASREHGCEEDRIRATIAVMEHLENGTSHSV